MPSVVRMNALRRSLRSFSYDFAREVKDLSPTLSATERAAVQKGVRAAQEELKRGRLDQLFGWKRDANGVVYVWDRHDEGLSNWGKDAAAAAELLASNVSPYDDGSFEPQKQIPSLCFRLGFLAACQGIFAAETAKYIPLALARRKRDNDGDHGPLLHDEDMLDARGVYRNNGRSNGRARRR